MKLTVVGGGSTYTPEIVDGLVRLRDRLEVTELALHDVSADRLAVLAAMSRRMLAAGDHPAKVSTYTDIAPAADGAEPCAAPSARHDHAPRAISPANPPAASPASRQWSVPRPGSGRRGPQLAYPGPG